MEGFTVDVGSIISDVGAGLFLIWAGLRAAEKFGTISVFSGNFRPFSDTPLSEKKGQKETLSKSRTH